MRFQFMKRSGVIGGGLVVAGLMISACAAVDDGDGTGGPEPGAPGAPLARVELPGGGTVSFYEPAPGALAIGQDLPEGVPPVSTDGVTAVEVFETIAPDQEVPAALIEAEARTSRPRTAAVPVTEQPEGTSITDDDFIDEYCSGNWSTIQFLPLHRNYPSTYADASTDDLKFSACANVGNIKMQSFVNGNLHGPWDILDNHCLVWHWWGDTEAILIGQIYAVQSSDRYDFCMRAMH